MNNRYLFRAKKIDTGEWVKGSLINLDYDSGYCYITEPYESASTLSVRALIYNHTYFVDRATICQCTGLKDKNGNLIWENDIVLIKEDGYPNPRKGAVKYHENKYLLKIPNSYSSNQDLVTKEEANTGREQYYVHYTYTVIGNIFDNPELLEVK